MFPSFYGFYGYLFSVFWKLDISRHSFRHLPCNHVCPLLMHQIFNTKAALAFSSVFLVYLLFPCCSCLTNIGWIFRNFFLSSLINCSITSVQIKIYFPHNLNPDGEGNQIVTNLSDECIFHKRPFSYWQNWALPSSWKRNCSVYTKENIFSNFTTFFGLFWASRLKILSKVSLINLPYFVLCAPASHEFITSIEIICIH